MGRSDRSSHPHLASTSAPRATSLRPAPRIPTSCPSPHALASSPHVPSAPLPLSTVVSADCGMD